LLTKSQKQHLSFEEASSKELGSSSSKCNKIAAFEAVEHEQTRIPPIRREYSYISWINLFGFGPYPNGPKSE